MSDRGAMIVTVLGWLALFCVQAAFVLYLGGGVALALFVAGAVLAFGFTNLVDDQPLDLAAKAAVAWLIVAIVLGCAYLAGVVHVIVERDDEPRGPGDA
jgi:hypothetical protein